MRVVQFGTRRRVYVFHRRPQLSRDGVFDLLDEEVHFLRHRLLGLHGGGRVLVLAVLVRMGPSGLASRTRHRPKNQLS